MAQHSKRWKRKLDTSYILKQYSSFNKTKFTVYKYKTSKETTWDIQEEFFTLLWDLLLVKNLTKKRSSYDNVFLQAIQARVCAKAKNRWYLPHPLASSLLLSYTHMLWATLKSENSLFSVTSHQIVNPAVWLSVLCLLPVIMLKVREHREQGWDCCCWQQSKQAEGATKTATRCYNKKINPFYYLHYYTSLYFWNKLKTQL